MLYLCALINDMKIYILEEQSLVRLQPCLIKKKITIYFENLIVELHVLYTLNTHIKFCVNQILFTI